MPARRVADDADTSYVTPLVRKMAEANGIDLNRVTGTGVGGRIRKQDILAAAEAARVAAEAARKVAEAPVPAPAPPARAAVAYFIPVFLAAFVLGVLRLYVVIPVTGAPLAVALEVPVVLALSWLVAGRVLRRWPLALPGRLAMGALAFGLLMMAELALTLGFGQTSQDFFAAMVTPAGALGLAGQIGFAVIPAIRRQPTG